jgi:putative tryptophan/tyrosine transport system substrate-binding protein
MHRTRLPVPNRRQLMAVAAGLVLRPLPVLAQRQAPAIGFLRDSGIKPGEALLAAFWSGMKRAGVEEQGRVVYPQAGATGQEGLQASARQLVQQGVAAIIADGTASAHAAKSATRSVPIVFVTAADPVASGLVGNKDRPESNVTGVTLASPELLAERFERLHQVAPERGRIETLANPGAADFEVQLQYLTDSARRHGAKIELLSVRDADELTRALDQITAGRDCALLVANDGFLNSQLDRLVAFAAAKVLPAAYSNREFVEAGGLMSYGPSLVAAYNQAGSYAGRIIRGETSAELPVLNPVAMELAINARTAGTLGLRIPPAIAAGAGELIN